MAILIPLLLVTGLMYILGETNNYGIKIDDPKMDIRVRREIHKLVTASEAHDKFTKAIENLRNNAINLKSTVQRKEPRPVPDNKNSTLISRIVANPLNLSDSELRRPIYGGDLATNASSIREDQNGIKVHQPRPVIIRDDDQVRKINNSATNPWDERRLDYTGPGIISSIVANPLNLSDAELRRPIYGGDDASDAASVGEDQNGFRVYRPRPIIIRDGDQGRKINNSATNPWDERRPDYPEFGIGEIVDNPLNLSDAELRKPIYGWDEPSDASSEGEDQNGFRVYRPRPIIIRNGDQERRFNNSATNPWDERRPHYTGPGLISQIVANPLNLSDAELKKPIHDGNMATNVPRGEEDQNGIRVIQPRPVIIKDSNYTDIYRKNNSSATNPWDERKLNYTSPGLISRIVANPLNLSDAELRKPIYGGDEASDASSIGAEDKNGIKVYQPRPVITKENNYTGINRKNNAHDRWKRWTSTNKKSTLVKTNGSNSLNASLWRPVNDSNRISNASMPRQHTNKNFSNTYTLKEGQNLKGNVQNLTHGGNSFKRFFSTRTTMPKFNRTSFNRRAFYKKNNNLANKTKINNAYQNGSSGYMLQAFNNGTAGWNNSNSNYTMKTYAPGALPIPEFKGINGNDKNKPHWYNKFASNGANNKVSTTSEGEPYIISACVICDVECPDNMHRVGSLCVDDNIPSDY